MCCKLKLIKTNTPFKEYYYSLWRIKKMRGFSILMLYSFRSFEKIKEITLGESHWSYKCITGQKASNHESIMGILKTSKQ